MSRNTKTKSPNVVLAASAPDDDAILAAADKACRLIPPLWPLATSVAVNPFLGHARDNLAEAAQRVGRAGGIAAVMPRDWYAEKIRGGQITDADLEAALEACTSKDKPTDVEALKAAAGKATPQAKAIPTLADLAAEATGTDWPAMLADRIGAWAAQHFDDGQALWHAHHKDNAWESWRDFAQHDHTPSLHGLSSLGAIADAIPSDPAKAILAITAKLGLSEDMLESCFHRLLFTTGGWGQVARFKLWQAEMVGGSDPTPLALLAIRLAFEQALLERFGSRIGTKWDEVKAQHAAPIAATADQVTDMILQEAAERAFQRQLALKLARKGLARKQDRPLLQAAFCIDVRSEVFRRALEAQDAGIETLGFAGFFGVFASHRRHGSDVDELRLPVLLNPTVKSRTLDPDDSRQREAESERRFAERAVRAWGRFRQAAVSSFAFVEAAGVTYAGKLVKNALRIDAMPGHDSQAPRLDPPMSLADRIGAANTVLNAMSLTGGFARIVLLAGHGANVVNNPHASALHCGACGGHAGDVNARLLAGLLNDPDVRAGLEDHGISVPQDTLFVAALHDTTTDTVTLYDGDHPSDGHKSDLEIVQRWLGLAAMASRAERAGRLPSAGRAAAIEKRAHDWAEVRPEWGLAGCGAFIAAPRHRTAGRALDGRAFLHDYDWKRDGENGYGVLELIMTAPVVVASWISLQYYGSVVASQAFGAGNKLLHNVTGGIGVVEGNGGTLRGGLPWQSVHDGENLMHDPLRLTVCIEAPIEAMTDILKRHEGVRALFDNRWLHLVAIDEDGRLARRYLGDLEWTAFDAGPAIKPASKAA